MTFENIDQLQGYFAQLQRYVGRLHGISRTESFPEAAEFQRRAEGLLRDLWFRLRQGPVRALVLGVSSAGKSTLINAMAGQIVVPEGKQTTSPLPVWVCLDDAPPDKPRIWILNRDDIRLHSIGRYDYLREYCYTSTEAGAGTGQEKYEDKKAAVVDVNSPTLATAGVTLIDTPGIGVSKGDNARVREVLAEGCEMLIILFMDLHQQEVKAYFTDLLADEDAPLKTLLDRGRVFLVLNATDEKHADEYAIMDTRAHIRDAFDGWDGEDRLFAFNAWDARISACGIYDYRDLLPEGYSEEEWNHAKGSEAVEVERAATAVPQEGLEALCDALGMAVMDLCCCEDAAAELLDPIQSWLEEAIRLLEQPYLDRIAQIQSGEYPVPPELAAKKELLEKKREKLQDHIRKSLEILSGNAEKSEEVWPSHVWASHAKNNEAARNYRLMADTRDEADAAMVKLIEDPEGLLLWREQIRTRTRSVQTALLEQLKDPATNPELKYWQELVAQMVDYLETRTDDTGRQIVPGEERHAFLIEAQRILEQAAGAGEEAGGSSGLQAFTEEEAGKIARFFREKRGKVMEGGFWKGARLFFLYVNAATEILTPRVERLVDDCARLWFGAFREELWSRMPALREQYMGLLRDANRALSDRLAEIQQEIGKAQEEARQRDLEQVLRELARLRLRDMDLDSGEL